jgi:hypothetical protein
MSSGRIPRRTHQAEREESRAEGVGGEGNAVVGADTIGEAVFLKQTRKDCFGAENSGGMMRWAADEVEAEVIGEGEGEQ